MPKGHIKSWRRDRGFGFIKVDGRDTDVFVHISELRGLGRPPRVGDELDFEIETQENDKVRAINCNVKDGGGDNSQRSSSDNTQNNNSSSGSNGALIAVVVLIVVAAGLYFFLK